MSDFTQIILSIAAALVAIGAVASAYLTYQVTLRVQELEKTLRTKEGQVTSNVNEEEGPTTIGEDAVEGDKDE